MVRMKTFTSQTISKSKQFLDEYIGRIRNRIYKRKLQKIRKKYLTHSTEKTTVVADRHKYLVAFLPKGILVEVMKVNIYPT